MITLRVPTSADAIPIQTYLAYQQAEDDLERVHVITGMSSGQIKGLKVETVDKIKSMFEDAVNTSEGKFERTITIDGVKLGFIPDLTAMSLGEYIDLDEYGKLLYKDKKLNAEVLMKVMAVLYRPVKMQIGKTYEIVPYDSNKVYQYIEQIGKLTMATCHGVLLFFWTLEKELLTSSREYLMQELKKTMKEMNS